MFDPFELAAARTDPYPTYRLLRDGTPAYYNGELDFWALSRFEDVRTASRDWATFSNADGVDLDELGRRVFGPGDFLDMDPPEHDELRAVVKGRFTPKAVASLEPMIRRHARSLMGGLADGQTFDAVDGLAWPLPVHVMSSIFGFTGAERAGLGELYPRVMARSPGQAAIPSSALDAAAELRERFVAVSRQRRERPRTDVMTQIALAEVGGRRLPDSKIAGLGFVLFSAGIDTVASLLASTVLLLAEHPSARDAVASDPGRLAVAIEEVLRYESPLQFNARTTTAETTIGGEDIPAGARVLLLYGSANRDERRFDSPDTFDIDRPPQRHLGFGEGIHFCIGAPLARLQTRVAMEELLVRCPRYELAGPVERATAYNMRSLSSLPILV